MPTHSSIHMPPHTPHAQAAALRLAYSEYGDLDVMERVAVLKALTYLALSSEPVREHFAAAVEAVTASQPRPGAKKAVRLQSNDRKAQ